MALYEAAEDIVGAASVELGLGEIADVWASTDPNVVQMRALLKRVGRRLALERQWSHLTRETTFSTASGTAFYDLPSDFSRMVDQSGWNRNSDQPATPLSPQQWQYLKATSVTGTLTVLFRPRRAVLEIIPTPSSVQTIAYEYASRYWVEHGDSPDADEPTDNDDVLLFDSVLLVPALKLAFLEAKGFDTTAALNEYTAALGLVASANVGAAPVLSLNGGRGVRILNNSNLPDSGYGS